MKIRRSVRRVIAWVVAVAVLAQTTACSYVPPRPDERTCEQEKTEVLAAAKDQTGTQDAIFFNATIDGHRSCAIAVPKDVYNVRLVATWSDGKTEVFNSFVLKIKPGEQYSVLAHETGVGYVPATAVLIAREPSEDAPGPRPWRAFGGLGGGGPIIGAVAAVVVVAVVVIVMIPVGISKAISKSERAKIEQIRSARLAMKCCHVWIEDAMTRETIAGIAPTTR